MKKIYITLLFAYCVLFAMQAQIGVNTETPSAALDVVSTDASPTAKALKVDDSAGKEIMTVRNDGYVGLGVANPITKLDLRSGTAPFDNAIGLGFTNMSAVDAKAGALRYNPTSTPTVSVPGENLVGLLEYSDGAEWIRAEKARERSLLIVQNSSNRVREYGSFPITHWDEPLISEESDFNRTTGRFTARRAGVYAVSLTAVLDTEIIRPSCAFELVVRSSRNGVEMNVFKKLMPYAFVTNNPVFPPSGQSTIPVTNTTRVYIDVEAGDEIFVTSYHNLLRPAPGGGYLDNPPKLSPIAANNVLSIAEL